MRRGENCGHAVVVQFVLVSFGSFSTQGLCRSESSRSSAQTRSLPPLPPERRRLRHQGRGAMLLV